MALQLLDALPVDALDAVSCFLSGWDVFELSHVNAQCWRHFSQPTHWRPRLPSRDTRESPSACSSKRTYAQSRSFAFEGLGLDERLSHCGGTDASGGVVVQGPSPREPFTDPGASFAVDAWFCLLDGERDGVLTGGVLFGGQSAMMRTCLWTNHHVAFVGVDGDRNLLCSVLDGGANCVAAGVDFGRWYHLALSFDCGVQKVFVDGELVSEMGGRLHHSWQELAQVQVGTGFVSSFWRQKSSFQFDTRPRRVRTFCGWHRRWQSARTNSCWEIPGFRYNVQQILLHLTRCVCRARGHQNASSSYTEVRGLSGGFKLRFSSAGRACTAI